MINTMENQWRLLIVDDEVRMRELLKYNLSKEKYEVETACDGLEGLEKAKKHMPDLIISDVMMPRMNGYEFCRALREHKDTQQVPFIFLTAKGQLPDKVEGLRIGADDYLTKPFDPRELIEMVSARLRRVEVYKKMADYDEFTGLLNHAAIERRLDGEIARAKGAQGRVSVGFIDVDSFGEINERYGHPFGDEVLKKISGTLRESTGKDGDVGRWGGEEFLVIYPQKDKDEAFKHLEEMRRTIAALDFPGSASRVTVSIGVASFPEDADGPEGLVGCADKALFTAKNSGRDRVNMFQNKG